MNWNAKTIKKQGFRLSFQRGFQSWFLLVIICAVFSYVGNSNGIVGNFLNSMDIELGLVPDVGNRNVILLKQYLLEETTQKQSAPFMVQLVEEGIDVVSQDFLWLVNLLAANGAYFQRNAAEVAVYLFLAALVSAIFRLFVQNIFVIGKLRYVMEHRLQKNTLFRRCLAPFHRKNFMNLIWVMLCYNVCIAVWSLTIVGGIYQYYQYHMIPYLLAENPAITRKEAFQLSKEMTKGYKWNMFLLDLSLWYVWLGYLFTPLGLLFVLPYSSTTHAEVYFFLRNNRKKELMNSECLTESAFDGPAWNGTANTLQLETVEFVLPDIVAEGFGDTEKRSSYQLTDLILIFFAFSVVGWLWEVGLHLVQHHELVNRGTMYGPWLPIYGSGATLCILLLDRGKKNQFRTFALIIVVAGILEYFTSWFLDFFCNSHYWEYYDKFANLNGRICLEGLLIFGFGGAFVIYIGGPYLRNHFHRLDKRIRVILCIAFCTLFLADQICCFLFGFNSGKGVSGLY